MTPEERDHIQSVLDDLQDRFKEVVATGRPELDDERIAALADGSIFSASQARANGLVDEIGDMEEAVALAERWAGLESSRVVVYHRPREYENNLYTRAPVPEPAQLGLSMLLGTPQSPGFYFLWTPGLQ
jgi:protease-4